MLDGGTNCGKGGITMAAVHGPWDHWWRRVWSGRTTCGADNLRRDKSQYQVKFVFGSTVVTNYMFTFYSEVIKWHGAYLCDVYE